MIGTPQEIDQVCSAALRLAHTGSWSHARDLLGVLDVCDRVRLVRAQVMLDEAFWTGSDLVRPVEALPRDDFRWESELLTAQARYYSALRQRLSGTDPAGVLQLVADLEHLVETAPDAAARSTAAFFLGVAHENLDGDVIAARSAYDRANAGDDLTTSYVLRHLAGHAADAGDSGTAHTLAVQALRLRQRAGHLPGALAQFLQIDDREPVRAMVTAWAHEIGATTLAKMANAGRTD